MIPQVDFFGTQVTRVIVGDNPINGHSYVPEVYPSGEMLDYYTAQNTVKALHEAEKSGVNTILPLANDFMIRVIRQYRNEGGEMNLIYQSYPPIDLKVNVRMMMETKPIAIYHQGTTTDNLCEAGNFEKLHDNFKIIRDSGVPVGFATHDPETILRSQQEGWDIDFYMACLYNARRDNRGEESGFITGKSKHLKFYPEDRFKMFDVIKKVSKPVIAFKIFAGGQIFYNKNEEEIPIAAKKALQETYDNIKPIDIACIGVFQKYKNQIKENTDIVKSILNR